MHVRTPALWLPLVAAATALPMTLGAQVAPESKASGDDTVPVKADVWSQVELERISEKIKGQIEKLRGQEFKHAVRVELQDKDGLIEYMKKRQDEFEPEAKRVASEELAKMFGLIPADLDLEAKLKSVIEQQVGGFYDPSDDAFYLMETFTGDLAEIILAHELTHALDDQWYDLDGKIETLLDSTDALEAYRSVIEGSATYAMQAWMMKYALQLDRQALMESQDMTTGGLDDAPAFIWKPLISAYMSGMTFMADGDRRDVEGFIELAFTEPPRSMEQVLHPEKYWDPELVDEPQAVGFELEQLAAGWQVLHQDTLGELYLALMTSEMDGRGGLDVSNPMAMLALKYTNDAAAGWDGDRVVLLGNGEARFARLVTVWDSAADAAEFEGALLKAFEELDESDSKREVRRAADDVVVVDIRIGDGDPGAVDWTLGSR